jgi:hypothetical protein
LSHIDCTVRSSLIVGCDSGVAGDPDLLERVAQGTEVPEHAEGVDVLTGRLGVAAGHEDAGDALAPQPLDDLGELAAPADHPRGQVGHGDVPVPGQPLGEVERRLETLAGRRGHGHREVARHVRQHLVLGGCRGQHLVPCVPEQPGHRLGVSLVAHGATRFVMRIRRRPL